jgi:hypothetical protein
VTGTGGSSTSGGATGSGGATASGGATGGGGTRSTGAATGSGGAIGSGGATASGGATGTGGVATGGRTGTGGATSTGGASATGGTGGRATGGATGTGGTTTPATLVQPILRTSGNYVLEFGNVFFEVDPKVGARVVTVKYAGGANLVTTKADNADNYGSTFRTSPQSQWNTSGWPPPPELDIQQYTMASATGFISGTSLTAASIGATVSKKFTPGLANDTIIAEYTIKVSADSKSFAPWEDTRVGPGGLTFYPTGSFTLPAIQNAAKCTWFKYPASVSASQRLISDGKEGWLAHVTADGTVIIKKFPDIAASAQAPGEGEISIYVDSGGKFVELETQGAYQAVPSGQSLVWSTTWYLRKLPSTITATVGNQALVDWVRGVIQ